ncbi:hypothetical protein [uncultured Paracoccus sp.]|uniref:hypothetical protein n=1 Tax=uncultured Paracoccus sp. TaxID=189685 RepID=UPI0025D3367E|nr:hypothetical protein [uncultured Paracoccus sp.]
MKWAPRLERASKAVTRAVDAGIPAVFQIIEWAIVVSALRWAASKTGSGLLIGLSWTALALLIIHLVRQLYRTKLWSLPSFNSYGQPIRLLAAWIAGIVSAGFLIYAMGSMVWALADALTILTDSQSLEAPPPPSYPPETPEKSVNVTGGQ